MIPLREYLLQPHAAGLSHEEDLKPAAGGVLHAHVLVLLMQPSWCPSFVHLQMEAWGSWFSSVPKVPPPDPQVPNLSRVLFRGDWATACDVHCPLPGDFATPGGNIPTEEGMEPDLTWGRKLWGSAWVAVECWELQLYPKKGAPEPHCGGR